MASKNISFDQIPSSIRKPGKYFEFNTKLAVRTLPANRKRMLILGQVSSTGGTVAAGVVTEVFSDAEAAAYFGSGSQAHRMVKAAIKANPYLALSVLPLANGTTAQTWTVTIANAATKAGALKLYVGHELVEIAIASGDANTAVAASLKAAIDNRSDLPVTAGVVSGVVTLTAKTAGTIATQTDMTYELVNVTGTTVTIAAATAGATDPDISAAGGLPKVAGDQYDVICSPFNASADLTKLITHLDTYSGPLEQKPGVGVVAMDDVLATVTTRSSGANAGRLLLAYLRGTKTPSYELAAAMAAVMAREEDPARPLNTLVLTGVHAPAVTDRFTRAEQESCLWNGAAPLEVGPSGTVQIVRAVSTYVHDANSIDDPSLLDITTITTLDYTRKAIRERVALRFPREKLSSRTPARVRSEVMDVLYKLEELEIIEEVDANKDGVIVERDLQDVNRLNVKVPVDVVNGLHVIAGRIDLLL
jgi:phage tail sheath gpL-like